MPTFDRRNLEMLPVWIREYMPPVGSFSRNRIELHQIVQEMAYELRTVVLADHLGEEQVRAVKREHHECLRFASWWDHFKATYRGRWWMRWRRWDVQYANEHHELVARVAVDLTRYWAFPRADIDLVQQLGEPVPWITQRPAYYSERDDA